MPNVIYEHGEPWWNDDRKTLDSSARALWQPYQQSPGSKQKEWSKGMRIWPCKVVLFILAISFLHAIKSYIMGPPALLHL
jgi:hypothetical protein